MGFNPAGTPGIHVPTSSRLPSGPDFAGWADSGGVPGGFDAWKQRQFSTASFGAGDPMAQQPGGFAMGGGGGGAGSKPWQDVSSWDPRSIMEGDAFKKLMEIANQGSGAPQNARQGSAPAMDFYKQALATGDPLGTQMLPDLQYQKGMAGLREAGQTADRRVDESAGGMNAMANPAMAQFMKMLGGFQQAGGAGEVSRASNETRVQERAASKSFQQGVAEAMAQLQAMLGGLDISDAGVKTSAAGNALTGESFARNTFAQLMAQLLSQSMRPGDTRTPADRGKGDLNPFPSPGDFGTTTGSQSFTNPFQQFQRDWLSSLGGGP